MSNLPSCDKKPPNFFHLKNTFRGVEIFSLKGLKVLPVTFPPPKNFSSKIFSDKLKTGLEAKSTASDPPPLKKKSLKVL